MNQGDIIDDIRSFIDREILGGQGADLSKTTPLFELGILDSFALFALTSFLSQRFGVDIDFATLAAKDFADIEHISALVMRNAGAEAAGHELMSMLQKNAAVTRVNPRSQKLFLVFTGNADALTMDPLRFLQVTGIADRNIMLFRDPKKNCYHDGIFPEHSGLDGVVTFIREEMGRSFRHVTEVFCVGASSGGFPALYCGQRLVCKAVWCLGARVVRRNFVADREAEIKAFQLRVLGRTLPSVGPVTLSAEESTRLKEALATPEMQKWARDSRGDPVRLFDHEMLKELVDRQRTLTTRPTLHFYFEISNEADRFVSELFRDCPNVELHPITMTAQQRADAVGDLASHKVAKLLDEQGLLGHLFRAHR